MIRLGLLKTQFTHRLIREEQEVFLPASPYIAKADIIITTKLPMSWASYLRAQGDLYMFAFGQKFGDVMTFASEAKCNAPVAAQRRLTFDLCSAQHQRRALGFKDGHVFGATVVRSTLTMYCSQWEKDDRENEKVVRIILSFQVVSVINDEKSVFPVTHFGLESFPAFVACYIFLCKVANHIGNEIDDVFSEWTTQDGRSKYEESSRKSRRAPWRRLAGPSRTTASDSSGRVGSGSSAQVDNGMSVTPNERQVHAGDQLVRENLQVFDAYPGVELKGVPSPPAKDIIGWVRTLAENHP